MVQFRERNPIPIGIAGVIFVVGLVFFAFSATSFAFIPGGGGHTYHALFPDASNIQKADDVRIAGIKVGEVSGVSLTTTVSNGQTVPAVSVDFKINRGTKINYSNTTATIKIKTLLGAMYLDVTPGSGGNPLAVHNTIGYNPAGSPLIITDAFEDLSKNIEAIDVNQLEQSFNTLSGDFENTPSEVSATLKGLSALSQTISSRDTQIQALLTHAQGVTTALASRDAEVTKLINDGQTVLNLVTEQRAIIHELLINTSTLAQQLSGLVQENKAILGPALTNLQGTVDILTKDQKVLDQGITVLAPFVRDFTNTLGNGPWFDTFIQNLSDATNPGCFTATATIGSQHVPLQTGGSGACA